MSVSVSLAGEPANWAHWRGPEFSGVARDKNLPSTWSPKGENLLWRNADVGTRCTPIAMNGKLYFVARAYPETTREGERTVCVDAATGELIWESIHNVYLSDSPAERVGWASAVGDPETGNIYILGLGGSFQCLNGQTGEVLWEYSMGEQYGLISPYGGRTNIPVVFENLVIISGVMTQWGDHAIPAHRFLAVDKRTGQPVWFTNTRLRPEDTTYSTPVFTTFNGQMAMVLGSSDGCLYAFQPRTGKVIWWYDASFRGFNTTPLIVDNIVYCGHAEKNRVDTKVLGAAFALDGRASGQIPEDKLLWKISGKTVGRSSPVMAEGLLYMVEDGANLLTIEPKSGKLLDQRKVGRTMFGSLLSADGKIYCGEANGNFWSFKPTPKGLEDIGRVRLTGEEILSSPIAYQGRLYVTTTSALYCIGQPGKTPAADPIPKPLPESPVSADPAVAHIQIVPVEALIQPGETIDYRVLAFNKIGQFLEEIPAKFTIEGVGAIDESGKYTAPQGNDHVAIAVTASVDDLTSKARARIIPPLPWSFDFNDGKVPATWIGAAYRHQPKEIEGEKTLVKISTIPKGTRSQSWMGQPIYHDYTVQADFYASGPADRRPDMGLINQRYTLDLMGKDQLQIRSWTPRLELRFAKTVPFSWEPQKWYSMKFQSQTKDGQAILRGKVWPRGQAEPKGWAIEAADATPNLNGSPGMFGNSSLTEFYIDNVKVFPN